jgi:hypothetical protein
VDLEIVGSFNLNPCEFTPFSPDDFLYALSDASEEIVVCIRLGNENRYRSNRSKNSGTL